MSRSKKQKTIKPQTLKGFRDFPPEDKLLRNKVAKIMEKVFQSFGYDPIENPALEYAEILRGKVGEEEKLAYFFKDQGGREIGLRYDQTIPLARFVAQYPDLPQPFKRYQLQKTWRADKPQKGRYREFYQFDFDIVNSDSRLADAEVARILYETMNALGFKKFVIKINNRKILISLAKYMGTPEKYSPKILRAIDKLSRIGIEGVEQELQKLKLEAKTIDKITSLISIKGTNEQILKKLKDKLKNIKEAAEGIKELEAVFGYLKMMDIKEKYFQLDLCMVRGLDYYTGIIYEIDVIEGNIGSVGGGGRYDNLIGMFTGKKIPATGIGWGFERLVDLIKERKMIKAPKTVTQVLVTIFSPNLQEKSIQAANQLRKAKINTELYLDPQTKLNKQLKYADKKGIPWVIIIGPEEVKEKVVVLKNMASGKQEKLTLKKTITKLTKN